MRGAGGSVGNLAAWAALVLLSVAAAAVAARLGFLGLLILGAAAWLVCTLAELDQDAPTWGADVFAARLRTERRPERLASEQAERRAGLLSLHFYRRCGILLTVVGALGFAWEQWR